MKVAFDVDGTLITLDNKPNYPVIRLFHALEALGCEMYIHSGGGVDYAEHWRDKLGLKGTVVEKFGGQFAWDLIVDDIIDPSCSYPGVKAVLKVGDIQVYDEFLNSTSL